MRSFLLILLLSVISCQRDDPASIQPKENILQADQESWGASFEISVDGITRAIIWSGFTAKFNRLQKINMSDSIHVDFFDQFGTHQSVLIADSGTVYEKRNDLKVWKNVSVISDSGIVLKTELLKWDNRRQRIYTDRKVIFYSEKDTLYGDGFESDAGLQNYEISNPRGTALISPENKQ